MSLWEQRKHSGLAGAWGTPGGAWVYTSGFGGNGVPAPPGGSWTSWMDAGAPTGSAFSQWQDRTTPAIVTTSPGAGGNPMSYTNYSAGSQGAYTGGDGTYSPWSAAGSTGSPYAGSYASGGGYESPASFGSYTGTDGNYYTASGDVYTASGYLWTPGGLSVVTTNGSPFTSQMQGTNSPWSPNTGDQQPRQGGGAAGGGSGGQSSGGGKSPSSGGGSSGGGGQAPQGQPKPQQPQQQPQPRRPVQTQRPVQTRRPMQPARPGQVQPVYIQQPAAAGGGYLPAAYQPGAAPGSGAFGGNSFPFIIGIGIIGALVLSGGSL